MQTIDLIILGILIEKPQSAYDIQKDIEYHHFDRWSRISIPSIYKKVIQLEEKGFLISSIAQNNKLFGKAVYTITDLGKKCFENLLIELSLASPLILFDFNILIANITKLSLNQSVELLANLKKSLLKSLEASQVWENEFSDIPFNGKAIITQQIDVYKLLIEWLNNFEKQVIEQDNSKDNGNC